MAKFVLALVFAALASVSCTAAVDHHGARIAIAPPLPIVVELGDPYYSYGGYHYYYRGDRWYYSESRGGPWRDLPRDRYPREVRFKGKGDEREWKKDKWKDHDKDWKKDRDRDHEKEWERYRERD